MKQKYKSFKGGEEEEEDGEEEEEDGEEEEEDGEEEDKDGGRGVFKRVWCR